MVKGSSKSTKKEEPQSYWNGVIRWHEQQAATEASIRVGMKGIFDFLRNLMIVGLLLFLSKITGSWILYGALVVAGSALIIIVFSLYEPLSLHFFHPMKNRRVAWWLDFGANLVIFLPLMMLTVAGLLTAVNTIADGYDARTTGEVEAFDGRGSK